MVESSNMSRQGSATVLRRRHEHMEDMSMDSMSMSGGPSLSYLQQMFWAVVGTAIAIAALVNAINRCLNWQR